jgi:prepilin peptidase CpaA
MFGAQYFFAAAVLIAVVAGWLDWRGGHIPNWLTIGTLLAAPLFHALAGYLGAGRSAAGQELAFSALGIVACGLVPVLFFYFGAIGGGDVKLLAAIGALCSVSVGIECEFYAFIAAALYAPGRLAYEGKLLRTLGNTMSLVINPFLPKDRRKEIVPEMLTELKFGPAIAVGTFISVWLHWRGP